MIRFLRGRTKEKIDGHMELYQAVRNGYEIKELYQAMLMGFLVKL